MRNVQDFDVGMVYKKKIVITNVSYSINFCKLSGLSEHLKDFIQIEWVQVQLNLNGHSEISKYLNFYV